MTLPLLLYFLGASVALTVAPGPDNLFVLAQGMARGRRAAIVTALGMCSGISVHTALAAFGISAVFYSSVAAFTVLKWAGAAYLLYLAWRALKERSGVRSARVAPQPAGALYRRGFLMNVLNPKVGMFFLAFLPQFVAPESGSVVAVTLLLGSVFMLQAVAIFCLIGYFGGTLGGWLSARPGVARRLDWLTAGVLASLGVRLALAQR